MSLPTEPPDGKPIWGSWLQGVSRELVRELVRLQSKRRVFDYVVGVAGILAALAAFALLYVGIVSLKSQVRLVGQEVVKGGFRITSPMNGDTVEPLESVRGTTPFRGTYHYIVVRAVKAGVDVVQPGPVSVGEGGSWVGTAKFGDTNVGLGELFMIRCVATMSKLQSGVLTSEPKDGVFTDPVLVVRRK
jgi:hypothetical protein